MKWHDNPKYNRSVSDEGYLLTWAYNPHGPYYNAWAPRKKDERRGKHLGSGYSRSDLEKVCREHHAKNVSRGFWESLEARP